MIYQRPVNMTTISIKKPGSLPTLGLQIKNDDRRPIITHCSRGSPAAKIPRWQTILKGAILYSINGNEVYTDSDIIQMIAASTGPLLKLCCVPPEPTDIHPETGLPQLNLDQFLHVAQIHQHNILRDEIIHHIGEADQPSHLTIVNKVSPKTFTRKQLIQRSDWKNWEASERLQLDQYEQQKMISHPGPIPSNITDYSILPMIWVYLIKVDGQKKARCVANGAPHLKGTITLANTYAVRLEQAACRLLFWAITAIRNKLVFGSDAVNAFAEAPPPQLPLFLKVDTAYCNWNHNKTKTHLPDNTYISVLQAIQGHPESLRLWNIHIDSILPKIGFTPTTHEPCIYIKFTPTETIYLLRQVDDFAIACDDKTTATFYLNEMDIYLKEPLKRETGLITRHNGIDIVQSSH